jgi:hypothetical protein
MSEQIQPNQETKLPAPAERPEFDEQKVLTEYEKLHKAEIDRAFKEDGSEQNHETPDAA